MAQKPRRYSSVLTVLVTGGLLASCAANPGPPPVEDITPERATQTVTTTPTTTTAPVRTEISAGVDGVRNGFNPHLIADSCAFVDSLAALVLPSAFVPVNGGPELELNKDLLESAEEIAPRDGYAQTVRYQIVPAAQWSDGTPVSGNDFQYLWRVLSSTDGVIDQAGYTSIGAVRLSGGGKTVEVDFTTRVAQWNQLFRNLLPAHLLQGGNFATALANGIPASAGRYMIRDADTARGIVTIARNDRFWGGEPAKTEIINFRAIRRTADGTDQLRTGQLSFIDVAPSETSKESYTLMPSAQVRTLNTGRQLNLIAQVDSPLLNSADKRADLFALIDVPQVAALGTGRRADLSIPEVPSHVREHESAGVLSAAVQQVGGVRVAADPADPVASASARVVVDQLGSHSIPAQVVSVDMATIVARRAAGDPVADIVLSWQDARATDVGLASRYGCTDGKPFGANISGHCEKDLTTAAAEAFAHPERSADFRSAVADTERSQFIHLPVVEETRLLVLGDTIVGPADKLQDWNAGISTAATWRRADLLTSTPTTAESAPDQKKEKR